MCDMDDVCRAVLKQTENNERLALCQCMTDPKYNIRTYDNSNLFLKVHDISNTGRNN